jgi:hypothetical protein
MSETQNIQVNVMVIGPNDASNLRFINIYLARNPEEAHPGPQETYVGTRTIVRESGNYDVILHCITQDKKALHLMQSFGTLGTMDEVIYIYPSSASTWREVNEDLSTWSQHKGGQALKKKPWVILQDGEPTANLACSSDMMKGLKYKTSGEGFRFKLESANFEDVLKVCPFFFSIRS